MGVVGTGGMEGAILVAMLDVTGGWRVPFWAILGGFKGKLKRTGAMLGEEFLVFETQL